MTIKFMSVDAAQFCLCLFKNPVNCLLSMNKSARRCVFCAVSKTWQMNDLPVTGYSCYAQRTLGSQGANIASR